MKAFVFIACSLDGFIARLDGSLYWLVNIPNPTGNDYGYKDFIKSIDAIIMGRNTFDVVSKFKDWPYEKPVLVFTNSLKKLDSKYMGKAEIIHGDFKSIINLMKDKRINNLYVDGGKTIQTFLSNDLIDEMIITTIPILLGNGIKLFDSISHELEFKILSSEVLNGEMIKTHYKRRNRTIVST
jgi:dihydrofolate reductase